MHLLYNFELFFSSRTLIKKNASLGFVENEEKHSLSLFRPLAVFQLKRVNYLIKESNSVDFGRFTAWPEDALERVAEHCLHTMPFEPNIKRNCVVMCKEFHTSVQEMSRRLEPNNFSNI